MLESSFLMRFALAISEGGMRSPFFLNPCVITKVRPEVAGHSNLETPELEKVRVFNALKVFPIGDLPLFAHVIKEGVHFDSFRIVKLAAVEIPAGRGAVGADRVHNGHHCEGSRSQAVTRANGTAKVVAEIWAAREGGRETSNRS